MKIILSLTIAFASLAPLFAAEESGAPKVGSKAPLFGEGIQTLEYNKFVLFEKLQELKAKKGLLILDFWSTTCVPCMRELPEFDRIHKELASKNVQFFAVSVDEKRQDIWRFIKEKKYTFPVLVDLNAYNAGRKYGADKVLPQLFIIDGEGMIRYHHTGEIKNIEAALKSTVESILPGTFPDFKGKAVESGETNTN